MDAMSIQKEQRWLQLTVTVQADLWRALCTRHCASNIS